MAAGQRVGQAGQLRPRHGDVALVVRLHAEVVAVDEAQRPHAVPLHLVGPARRRSGGRRWWPSSGRACAAAERSPRLRGYGDGRGAGRGVAGARHRARRGARSRSAASAGSSVTSRGTGTAGRTRVTLALVDGELRACTARTAPLGAWPRRRGVRQPRARRPAGVVRRSRCPAPTHLLAAAADAATEALLPRVDAAPRVGRSTRRRLGGMTWQSWCWPARRR